MIYFCNLKFLPFEFFYYLEKPTLGRRAPTLLWTEYNSNCSQWVAFCFILLFLCLFALLNCSNERLLLCRWKRRRRRPTAAAGCEFACFSSEPQVISHWAGVLEFCMLGMQALIKKHLPLPCCRPNPSSSLVRTTTTRDGSQRAPSER